MILMNPIYGNQPWVTMRSDQEEVTIYNEVTM